MWDIGCVFRSGLGRQMRQAVRFKIKGCRCSGVVCFQICFLQLICFIFSWLIKCRGLGQTILESVWRLWWSWEVNRQLIHKVAPCDSNQVWERRCCSGDWATATDFYLLPHVPSGKWRGERRYLSCVPLVPSLSQYLERSRAPFIKGTGTARRLPVDCNECRLPLSDYIRETRTLY